MNMLLCLMLPTILALQSYLQGVETSTKVNNLDFVQPTLLGFYIPLRPIQMIFTRSFSKTFKNPPLIYISMITMDTKPDLNGVQKLAGITETTVDFDFKIFLNLIINPRQYRVVFYFIAIDIKQNPNFETQYMTIPNVPPLMTGDLTFSRKGVDESVYRGCFMMDISNDAGSRTAFLNVKITCTPTSPNILKFTYQTDSYYQAGYSTSSLTISGLVLFPDQRILIAYGDFIVTTYSGYTSLPFDMINTEFFIGFTMANTTYSYFNVSLNLNTMTNIDTTGRFVQIRFSYLLIVQRYICPISQPSALKTDLVIPQIGLLTFMPALLSNSQNSVTRYYSRTQLNGSKVNVIQILSFNMSANINDCTLDLTISGCNSLSSNSFEVTNNNKVILSSSQNGSTLGLSFQMGALGNTFQLDYSHMSTPSRSYFNISIPAVFNMKSSLTSTLCSFDISYLASDQDADTQFLSWKESTSVSDPKTFSLNPDKSTITLTFIRLEGIYQSDLKLIYDPTIGKRTEIIFKFVTVKKIESKFGSDNVKIHFMNIPTTANPLPEQFICDNGLDVVSVETGDFVVITLNSTNLDENEFQISYSSASSRFSATVSNIKVIPIKSMNVSDTNDVTLIFKNIYNFSESDSSTTPSITVDTQSIQFVSMQITEEQIIIICQRLSQTPVIQIKLQTKDNKFVQNIFAIDVSSLIFCPNNPTFKTRNKVTEILSIVLSALYLFVFVFCMFCCKKLYGLDLIYIMNLGFYSLIPIDIFCQPFRGLNGLQYITGYNPFFKYLEQATLEQNYQVMGILSNFFSNVNLMIFPLVIVPFLYFPLKYIGKNSKNYTTSPRCLKYGRSLLFQVPLTILLFNSFNIYTSIVVNIQAFNWQNYQVLIPSLAIGLLLPAELVVYLLFSNKFSEFVKEFEGYKKLFSLNKQKSVLLRKMYVVCIIVEMTLAPIFLATQPLFKLGLYCVLGIQVVVTIYVFVIPLYSTSTRNFRNCLHRIVVLSVCSIQIMALNVKTNNTPTESFIYWYPFLLLALLLIGLLSTGGHAMYQCVQFIKSPKLIDNKMKLEQQATTIKPQINPFTSAGIWIEKNEFSIYRKRKQMEEQLKRSALISDPLMKKQATSQIDYQPRIKSWFKQLEGNNYFSLLGVNGEAYKKTSSMNQFFQYKFMSQLFLPSIDILVILKYNSGINTLSDLIDYIGPRAVETVRCLNGGYQD